MGGPTGSLRASAALYWPYNLVYRHLFPSQIIDLPEILNSQPVLSILDNLHDITKSKLARIRPVASLVPRRSEGRGGGGEKKKSSFSERLDTRLGLLQQIFIMTARIIEQD